MGQIGFEGALHWASNSTFWILHSKIYGVSFNFHFFHFKNGYELVGNRLVHYLKNSHSNSDLWYILYCQGCVIETSCFHFFTNSAWIYTHVIDKVESVYFPPCCTTTYHGVVIKRDRIFLPSVLVWWKIIWVDVVANAGIFCAFWQKLRWTYSKTLYKTQNQTPIYSGKFSNIPF